MTTKSLRDELKTLRDTHTGKAIGRMTPEELQSEIEHHTTAIKARALKASRMAALAKAREARTKPKEEKKEEEIKVKVPTIKKAEKVVVEKPKAEPKPKTEKKVKAEPKAEEPKEEKKPVKKGMIAVE
jgi:hypothetical protein